jgi:hypothetical protein
VKKLVNAIVKKFEEIIKAAKLNTYNRLNSYVLRSIKNGRRYTDS